jgi:hypothetical protein
LGVVLRRPGVLRTAAGVWHSHASAQVAFARPAGVNSRVQRL